MTESTEMWWAGSFGDAYTERNQVDPASRLEFWRSAIAYCSPATVLEVGCNRGHNLAAIQTIDSSIDCHGVDVNVSAVNEARSNGISAEVGSALEIASKFGHESMDIVLTAGVLIHIPPKELPRVMQAIIDTTAKYILAVEYPDDEESEIVYRGHAGKLWKRPFGKLYQEMGCTLISTGPALGFEECQFWLLSKPGARDLVGHEELF